MGEESTTGAGRLAIRTVDSVEYAHMRPPPARVPGRIPGLAALLCLSAGLSCREPTRPDDGGVRRIAISVPSLVLRPGFIVQAIAEPLDAAGMPVPGRTIIWRSLTPSTLLVSDGGQLLPLAPGEGKVRASVGSVSGNLTLALVNPPVATLTISTDTVRLLLPGGSAQLVATARDAEGVTILRPRLEWESSAARIANVATTGLVSAESAGRATIIAYSEGRTDTARVFVDPVDSPNAPKIVLISPQLAIPGSPLVVDGSKFAPSAGANAVLLDGVTVTVTSATSQRLELALPDRSQFACVPTGLVTLQVTTSGGIGVGTVALQMAPQRALQPGESLVMPTAVESRCVELAPADGRYLITVQNTTRTLGPWPMAFTLGGTATAMGGAALRAELTAEAPSDRPTRTAEARLGQGRRRAHARMLERNIELSRTAPMNGWRGAPAESRIASLQAASVGTVVPIRVLDLEAENLCGTFTVIGARTAFVGLHVIILEDTTSALDGAPTLQGTMDDLYRELGAEFENVVWPVLQKFGNPLVMDSRLDDNGRVVLVFTPRMNQMLGGSTFAVTTSCDLFPRVVRASSNVGEYLYAQVPTSPAAGNGPGTRERWMTDIRATIAHELKHVVSYAERTVRGLPFEEGWLEEATARHAEELYARAVFGTQQSTNLGYDATLRCEVNSGAGAPCPPNAPRALLPHFDALWDFLDASAMRSPLGATSSGDYSYYGAAWALTRWMLDHGGIPEQTFFTAVTLSQETGVANLEKRFGRPWAEMLGEWSLAMATDDISGFSPASPRLRFPSWDLRAIFLGLCIDAGSCNNPATTPSRYLRPYPLQPVPRAPGLFSLEFPAVHAGGFAAVELSGGDASTRQLLQLRGYRGAALPADARLAIIRIQ